MPQKLVECSKSKILSKIWKMLSFSQSQFRFNTKRNVPFSTYSNQTGKLMQSNWFNLLHKTLIVCCCLTFVMFFRSYSAWIVRWGFLHCDVFGVRYSIKSFCVQVISRHLSFALCACVSDKKKITPLTNVARVSRKHFAYSLMFF